MSERKRPWGVVAGPVILVVGLIGFYGVRSAIAVAERVDGWGDALEHSSAPVVMEMPDVPMIPPLYVNGDRIGRIETIVVERDRPASIDSLTVLASVGDEHLAMLEGCALRLRVRSFDESGYKRALRCTRDTQNLAPFGHMVIEGHSMAVPIMVRVGDLPCDNEEVHVGPCGDMSAELRAELEALQRELDAANEQIRIDLRLGAEELREQLLEVREQLRNEVRTNVRSAVRVGR